MLIGGVDEAGRGPLAGPVYAAAVILPPEYDLPGLGDSKAISEKRRETLFPEIQSQAVAYAVAMASVGEIAERNIRQATKLAMRRAVEALTVPPGEVWVDGNMLIGSHVPERCFVGGDRLHPCISAASVLAKVTRDRHIRELHERYPQYGFDRHKGYGTALHAKTLLEHGPCPEHRAQFVKTFLSRQSPQPTLDYRAATHRVGAAGEQKAAEHLEALGFRVIERNFRRPYGEIDLIAEDGTFLVFAEVKTRKNRRFAAAAEAVGPDKRRKILKTARGYLAAHNTRLQPRFDVIEVYTESGEVNHIPNAFTE